MAKKTTTTDATTTDGGSQDASQLGPEITATLANEDTTAAQRVQNLQWVYQARVSQLTRAAAVLKTQYGADDPGVKSAEAAVAAANSTAARVGMATRQAATAEPKVSANGWALHGRVFDAQLQPVSGFTVFLVDASKTYQQAYGFAYTDSTGYFLLNNPGPDAATKASATATAPEMFVEVVDGNARPVYLSTTPFYPLPGVATYQNITLAPGNVPIGDPPAQIRNVAIPKAKRATTKQNE